MKLSVDMCPEIYQHFANLLVSTGVIWDETSAVLEIGATLDPDTLLTLPCMVDAKRMGINKDPKQTQADRAKFSVYRFDANAGPMTPYYYDLVLCNSVLEHDPQFWLTIAEMHRVLKPGGWLAVGAPSFSERLDAGPERTITMERHDFPADYYRFSPAMFREVVFGGFEQVTILDIMDPPRCVGIGRKI